MSLLDARCDAGARGRGRPGGHFASHHDGFAVRVGVAALRASSCRPRASSSCRAIVSEQYPQGLGHTAPEVGAARERAATHREDRVLGGARGRASTLAGATRRSCAGSRRTCASARPSTICSSGASRCTCPPTPSARATSSTTSAAWSAWSARAPSSARSRRSLFELLERAGTPEFKAVQKLIL